MANRERVRRLVAGLRSGEFVQGKGSLEKVTDNGENRHCCLGVACRVAMANGLEVVTEQRTDCIAFDDETALLPRSVQDWYGFIKGDPFLFLDETGNAVTAVVANDSVGLSFELIASAFEDYYVKGGENK